MRKEALIIMCAAACGAGTIFATGLNLPDLFTMNDGTKVTTAEDWTSRRRPETLEWYRANMYGRAPLDRPADMTFKVVESDAKALNGTATRKQVRVNFTADPNGPGMNLLIYLPNQVKRPCPVFVVLNGRGNQTVHTDPGIIESTAWNKPGNPERDKRGSAKWPVEKIIARGYGIATAHTSDLSHDDNATGLKSGVIAYFDSIYYPDGRPDDAWGTIAAWAWGLSRAMDYFETDPDIDQKRVAVSGHSRRGKASLWCGAQDERFKLTVSNGSCGQGAAMARIKGGNDTITHLAAYAPHWFCKKWQKYKGMDETLPVDQHMFLALIAPRLLYVNGASSDRYAPPVRDFTSCIHASPAWELFGLKGLTTDKMPGPEQPLHDGMIGYHIRPGNHGHEDADWQWQMDFADKHLQLDFLKPLSISYCTTLK